MAQQTTISQPLPLIRRVLWGMAHVFFTGCFRLLYRLRWYGRRHIPATGPVLLVSNHQSFFDPILVGVAARRPFFSMARESLFHNPLFGWAIRTMLAVPLRQDGQQDMATMRQCIDLLKAGHMLLLFPEGTRSEDGRVLPFKPGLMLLIKRARPTVVPVAIEGAFDVWPRSRKLPALTGRIAVQCGQGIPAEELINMPADQALEHLGRQVENMRLQLRERLTATGGHKRAG